MTSVKLPKADGGLETYTVRNAPLAVAGNGPLPRLNRIAYAAAHVVANPLADNDPWLDTAVDWERTIAFRHYLWDLGLGVAEAMDTAQRGMGLDWNGARELIRRSLEAAKSRPGVLIASGAGTEQLEASASVTLDDVIRAYETQMRVMAPFLLSFVRTNELFSLRADLDSRTTQAR